MTDILLFLTTLPVFAEIILLGLVVIFALFAVEADQSWGTFFTLASAAFLVYITGYTEVVLANPMLLGVAFIASLLIGAAWATYYKWPNWIHDNRESIQQRYEIWVVGKYSNKADTSIEGFLNSDSYTYYYGAQANKGRIINWIMLWPASVVWELIHRPVTAVYDHISNTLVSIGKKTAASNLQVK